MSNSIFILQHVPFEPAAQIEYWLKEHNLQYQYVRLYEKQPLPSCDTIKALIVMGGPMSVNDEHLYPWIISEKHLIAECIRKGLPVLGICLGAQMIASALGCAVYRNTQKEIGWFSVRGIHYPSNLNLFQFPDEFFAFHWHGETFDLPKNSFLLASTEICSNQAFQLGSNVLGLQFHLETTTESLSLIIENCKNELTPSSTIQSAEVMVNGLVNYLPALHKILDRVLSYLFLNKQ